MTIGNGDITITYSGGGTNNDPDLSLGGEPSVHTIFSKRLFDDISEEETIAGMIDYRCFYLNNENAVDTLYLPELSVLYSTPGSVTVQLGFNFVNERQVLTVTNSNTITGGFVILEYEDLYGTHVVSFNWHASLEVWANNLQTELRTITNLDEVTVIAYPSGTSSVFEIDFVGSAANRYHETILLATGGNNLTSSGSTSVSITKTVSGGPINSIADEIDIETTEPNNIVFTSDVVNLDDLRPLDSIPVWVKRIVPASTAALETDGFTFKVKGSAIV